MSAPDEPLDHQRRLEHHRLRAPRENGQALVLPDRKSIVVGKPFEKYLGARREFIAAARRYTAQYRDVPSATPESTAPIILAGHQPELFHPGVWFKNFLLSSLADSHHATGINLIVDNDTISVASIAVPTGSRSSPRVENVAFDRASAEVPFEQREILDQEWFASFAERTKERLSPWLHAPLIEQLWPLVIRGTKTAPNLGWALAQGRHALEGEIGLNTLEVPLSTVFSQATARQFLFGLISDAAWFAEVHNSLLVEYRRVNKVRSTAHPVPNLVQENGWIEVPLWIWSNGSPRRRHLFVRKIGEQHELSNRGGIDIKLPADEAGALEAWQRIEESGIKIRPRALITTMYSRLVLCDQFIHGIGGAKYDELTDAIIRKYFGITPPGFIVATATLQLPIDFPKTTYNDVLKAKQRLRDLTFHPETFIESNANTQSQVAHKRELLIAIPGGPAKKAWHQELSSVNEQLQPAVAALQARGQESLLTTIEQHRYARLLGSREFSFGLFPYDFLADALLDLAREAA